MYKSRRAVALSLVLLLLLAALPAQAAVFCHDVRVLLSLGKQQEFSFTPVGEFTLKEDPALTVGNEELLIKVTGGHVSMEVGGKTVQAAELTLLSGHYGERTDYIRLRNAEHGTCTYLGNLTFSASGGFIRAVNTLPLDQYLYGVVPHEMSNLFPVDALKAQAVCARGYAVAKCASSGSRAYDLVDTSSDQVYRGYASRNRRAIAAVDETSGQVLLYEGDIIESYYSASNGGQTERTGNVWQNDFPYYTQADDSFDLANASSLEEKSFIPEDFTFDTMRLMDPFVLLAIQRGANEAAGQGVTLLKTVLVTPKSPTYEAPSRVYEEADITLMVEYAGENGEKKTGQLTIALTLADLRFGSFENTLGRIGASKTRLRMRGAERGVYSANGEAYPGFFLTERRYGHGVGLSQRGAQERARAGQKYTEILSFYYVGTNLIRIGGYETAPKIQSDGYLVREWGISGISPGTDTKKLLDELTSEGSLSVVNAKGRTTEGIVGTGYYVRDTYENGQALFDLPIVIFGDVNGDGSVDESDIPALQAHLARATFLSGARLSAADVNHDGEVNASDLLRLIRHVNGDADISQKAS